jgi:hypothetical protein
MYGSGVCWSGLCGWSEVSPSVVVSLGLPSLSQLLRCTLMVVLFPVLWLPVSRLLGRLGLSGCVLCGVCVHRSILVVGFLLVGLVGCGFGCCLVGCPSGLLVRGLVRPLGCRGLAACGLLQRGRLLPLG